MHGTFCKAIALVAMLLAILPILPVQALSSAGPLQADSDGTLSYAISIEGFRAIRLDFGYDLLIIPNCGFTSEPGKPMLPAKTVAVLLPPYAELDSMEITPLHSYELPTKYLIAPTPEPAILGYTHNTTKIDPDFKVYNQPTPYPGRLYDYQQRAYKMRGYRLAFATLYPAQYVPAERKVIFYDKFEIKVHLKPAEPAIAKPCVPTVYWLVQNIINPEMLAEYGEFQWPQLSYLIIARYSFSSAAQQLATIYEDRGFTVYIKYVEDIVATYSGQDTPEKIRNCIIEYYRVHNIVYVLLLGDADPDDTIPTGTEVSITIESPHPYPNNAELVYQIAHPGAANLSIHFDTIDLEYYFDYIYVFDESGNMIASYTGYYKDVWTPLIPGDTAYVALRSDYDITAWGFLIDKYMYNAQYYTLDKDWEIPTRYAYNPDLDDGSDGWCTGLPNDYTPTDYYYAGLDGTWDIDGDGVYGESGYYSYYDEADWLPEVFVGRLPVRSTEDASAYVSKLNSYLEGLTTRRKGMLLLGAHLFDTDPSIYTDGAWIKEQVAQFYPPEVATAKLYENEGNLTYSNVVNQINTLDPSLVSSASHGSTDGLWLYWNDQFANTTTPDYVANTGFTWYAMACLSGAFDIDELTNGECFGEAIVRHWDGSSIAYIGATRVTWAYINDWLLFGLAGMQDWLYHYYYSKLGAYGPGVSLYLADTNYYSLWSYTVSTWEEDRKTLFAQMLLGDPAVPASAGLVPEPVFGDYDVGDMIAISGTQFAPNAHISIYMEYFDWYYFKNERVLAATTMTDDAGSFSASLQIPPDVRMGVYHLLTAVDEYGNIAFAGSIYIVPPPPEITLTPQRGCGNFIVNITGRYFTSYSNVHLYIDGAEIFGTGFFTDQFGAFNGSFIVPTAQPDIYVITATDSYGLKASAYLTIVDITPLTIDIDVGSVHFAGELTEFYALTSFNGTPVNVTITKAYLYFKDTIIANLTDASEQIGMGLYRVPYAIPNDASVGTYTLVMEARCMTDIIESKGTSLKSFLVSSTLTGWNAWLLEVKGNIATIKTDVGMIKVSLNDINATITGLITDAKGEILLKIDTTLGTATAKLEDIDAKLNSINGTVVEISSLIGNVTAKIDDIHMKVVSIDWETKIADIQSDLGKIKGYVEDVDDGGLATIKTEIGDVKLGISDIKKQFPITVDMTPVWIAVVLSLIAAIAAIYAVITIRQKIAG